MTVKFNTFEGLADETAITAGNSGGSSGDAFDSDVLNATADTLRAAHGLVSCRCSVAGASTAEVAWATVGTTWYGRVAFYLPAAPPANMHLVQVLSAGTLRIMFSVLTTRAVRIISSGFADLGTSSTILATGQWNGLEFQVIEGGPGTNLAQVKIYTNQQFEAPTETVNATSTTVSAYNKIRFGAQFSANQTYDLWQDSLGISDVGYLGNTGLVAPRQALIGRAAVQRSASW